MTTLARSTSPELTTGRERHSALLAAVATMVVGYATIVAVLTAFGLVLTNVLVDGPVGRADEHVTRWLADHRTGTLNAVTLALSRSADTAMAVGIAALVVVVLALRRRWVPIVVIVAGLVLELASFLAVNYVVDRPRPSVPHLGSVPTTSSYPSGHTAATLVIYVSVALVTSETVRAAALRTLAWVAAVVMPLAVGWSRVYRGMHHPLDVAAGLLTGLLVVVLVQLATRRWLDARADERDDPTVTVA